MKEELISLLKSFEVYGITSTLEKNENLENHYQLTFSSPIALDTLFESAVIQVLDTLGVDFLLSPNSITTAIDEVTIPVLLLHFKTIPKLLEPAPVMATPIIQPPEEKETKEIKHEDRPEQPSLVDKIELPIDADKNKEELPAAVLQVLHELEEDPKTSCQHRLIFKINHLADVLDRDTTSDETNPSSYVQSVKNTVKSSYQASKNIFFNPYLNSSPTAVWLRAQLAAYKDNFDTIFSFEQLNKLSQLLDARLQHVPTLCEKAKKSCDEKLTKRYDTERELLSEALVLIGRLIDIIKLENDDTASLLEPSEEDAEKRKLVS